MKKIHFLWFALVAMSISSLTACSDDVLVEPEQPQYTTAESFSPIGKWQFHDTVDLVLAGQKSIGIYNYKFEFFDNDSVHFSLASAHIKSHYTTSNEHVVTDVMGAYEVFYDARKVVVHLNPYEIYDTPFENVTYTLDFDEEADIMVIPERNGEWHGAYHYPAFPLHRVDDWE